MYQLVKIIKLLIIHYTYLYVLSFSCYNHQRKNSVLDTNVLNLKEMFTDSQQNI